MIQAPKDHDETKSAPLDLVEESLEQLGLTAPANSHRSKQGMTIKKSTDERVKAEKIIQGKAVKHKKSFGKKLVEEFIGEDTKGVVEYVFYDVLIHAAKSMICDMIGWGGAAEMILFGDKRGGRGRTRNDGSSSRTNYNGISRGGGGSSINRGNERRNISREERSRHDFDNITFANRGDATDVLDRLVDQTLDYGEATVAMFYEFSGEDSSFTDISMVG
jgi:hypothetical protein